MLGAPGRWGFADTAFATIRESPKSSGDADAGSEAGATSPSTGPHDAADGSGHGDVTGIELAGTRYADSFPASGRRLLPGFLDFAMQTLGVDPEYVCTRVRLGAGHLCVGVASDGTAVHR